MHVVVVVLDKGDHMTANHSSQDKIGQLHTKKTDNSELFNRLHSILDESVQVFSGSQLKD